MYKKLSNIGDCGIICDFGDEVNKSINTEVIKLFKQGVKITVSSDDPPFFNASIAGEYNVMKILGLSDNELKSLTRNAITYAFCDQDIKSRLLNKI